MVPFQESGLRRRWDEWTQRAAASLMQTSFWDRFDNIAWGEVTNLTWNTFFVLMDMHPCRLPAEGSCWSHAINVSVGELMFCLHESLLPSPQPPATSNAYHFVVLGIFSGDGGAAAYSSSPQRAVPVPTPARFQDADWELRQLLHDSGWRHTVDRNGALCPMLTVPRWSRKRLMQSGTFGGLDGVTPSIRAIPCCTSRPFLFVHCKVCHCKNWILIPHTPSTIG